MDLSDIVRCKLESLGAGPDEPYLAAVSGGADSTALLLAMRTALGKGGRLTAAHLDHGVRPGSSTIAVRVEELCRDLGVRCILGRLDSGSLEAGRRQSGSLEAGMRDQRYRFLDHACRQSGSRWIVTGHTADDQAETVLFRVLRRMDWRSFGAIPEKRGNILRPLLSISRVETVDLCEISGVSFDLDPTNTDESYTRARIRNTILPALSRSLGPCISPLLREMGVQASRLQGAEDALLASLMPVSSCGNGCSLDMEEFIALPGVLRKGAVTKFLYRLLGKYPSGVLAADVTGFLEAGRNGDELTLPGNRILTLDYGHVNVSGPWDAPLDALPSRPVELKIPGEVAFPALHMRLKARRSSLEEHGRFPRGNLALISKKAVEGSLWVRRRLPGDVFTPLGMANTKKLQDFLVDRKTPRRTRDRIPLVLGADGAILWVGGIGISQEASLEGFKGEEAILLELKKTGHPGHERDDGAERPCRP